MVKKRTIKIVMFYLFCLFPNSHLISLFKISSLTFRLFFHYKLNRPFFCEHIATDCNFDPDFQYVLYFLILSVFCRSAEYFSVCFFPGRPSSFSCLDGKESPGGVAVGCYTRRVTDRA